jgi:hypothetical protein
MGTRVPLWFQAFREDLDLELRPKYLFRLVPVLASMSFDCTARFAKRIERFRSAGGRLHLGPLIPPHQWLALKGAVDTLVGPSLRDPQIMKRTLSSKLEYGILHYLSVMSQRKVQNTIAGWFNSVRKRVPELNDHNDLLFALKRLRKRELLRLVTLEGIDYQGNPNYDTFMFFRGEFITEITPEGWSYWESIKD